MFRSIGRAFRIFGVGIEKLGFALEGKNAFREQLNRSRRLMNLGSAKPEVGSRSWVAPNASLIGNVELGDRSSVWYGAVLRGDVNKIKIGKDSSIGDRVLIHVSSEESGRPRETIVGDYVNIEPGAILHACTVENESKVGMGAILLDGVVLGKGSVVAPGSLVPPGKHIPPGELWAGSPAKFVRKLEEKEKEDLLRVSQLLMKLAAEHDQEHLKSRVEKISEDDSKDVPEKREPLI